VADLLFPITAKLKRQNHAGIFFTNFEFVSRNYAKQNAGCDWVGRINKLGMPTNFTMCLNEIEELIRIFVASIRTAEKNAK